MAIFHKKGGGDFSTVSYVQILEITTAEMNSFLFQIHRSFEEFNLPEDNSK